MQYFPHITAFDFQNHLVGTFSTLEKKENGPRWANQRAHLLEQPSCQGPNLISPAHISVPPPTGEQGTWALTELTALYAGASVNQFEHQDTESQSHSDRAEGTQISVQGAGRQVAPARHLSKHRHTAFQES